MRLSALAAGYPVAGTGDPEITGVTEDSRRVSPGMLFVAIRGTADDGHRYIGEAVARGAAAVLAERFDGIAGVPCIHADSPRAALAELAARFAGHPARDLRLIGFTGTFGKTSTSAILRELLDAGGARTGLLGSLGARYGSFHDPGSGLTTPAPVELHAALQRLRDAGANTVIMEVTSHALLLERVRGLTFSGGLLAAVRAGEHSDFHGSYDDYVAAKRRLLDFLSPDATLAYDADNHAARAIAGSAAVAARSGVSLHGRETDVRLTNISLDHRGATFTLRGRRLRSSLLGRGHLENVALALAYAFAAGVPIDAARQVLRRLRPLPRRMERYDLAGRLVLDDTAGHPESLRATFEVAAMLERSPLMPDGRMIVVHAIRGSRGADVNARNAAALSDLVAEHGGLALIVTASNDVAGPNDRARDAEVDATRRTFAGRHQRFEWFDGLGDAARRAVELSRPGDLLVLVGAQGMNEGRRLLTNLQGR
jgi:UDP-N-acetylmuramoyl-L-alanyl-D-glutamate--2,6-diaminopimelate ligase